MTNVEEEQSDCSEEVVGAGDEAEVMQDLLLVPQRRTMSQGFASLDCVNLEEVFQVRALVMKTVPMFMRGAFRAALKVGLEEKGAVDRKRRGVDQRMDTVFIVATDVVIPSTQRRPDSTTQVGRTFGTLQQWGLGHTGRTFIGARDEWDHDDSKEEASQQKRHQRQNCEGLGSCHQHGMCWSLFQSLRETRPPRGF